MGVVSGGVDLATKGGELCQKASTVGQLTLGNVDKTVSYSSCTLHGIPLIHL